MMIPKKSLLAGGLAALILISFLLKKEKTSIETINSKDQKKQQIVATNINNNDLADSAYKEKNQNNIKKTSNQTSSTRKLVQKKKQNTIAKTDDGKKKIKSSTKKDTKTGTTVNNKINNTKVVNTIKQSSRFYGKANIYAGYAMMYSNSYDVVATLGLNNKYANVNNSVSKMNKNVSGVLVLNYNFYYKLFKFIHPFIGIDIMGKYPFSSDNEFNFKMDNLYIDDIPCYYNLDVSESVKMKEYGRINAKLGARINFHKNFGIEPYALAGLNITRKLSVLSTVNGEYRKNYERVPREIARDASFENSKTKMNFTIGGGFDIVFADKYIVGMEYYNYRVDTGCTLSYEGGNKEFSINMKREKFTNHNFLVKFGVRF